jgi:hypothetical protein
MSLNDILFALVCLAAVYARSVSAALFCAAYAMHSFYSPVMEQWMRYVVLILIDSATAFAVVAIKRPSRASVITGVSSGVFLAVNVAGFVAWYLYLPPATYDAVCSVVYIAMGAALINEGSNGRRRLALHDMGDSSAGAPVHKGMGVHHKDAGEV